MKKIVSDQRKNIYLFCGEDSFSAFETAMLWKEKFLEKYGDLNLLVYRGEELTGTEFQTAIESLPFLSEKKLILISDFLREGKREDQEKIISLLDDVPDFVVVLFLEHANPDKRTAIYKKLVKIAQINDFPAKSGFALNKWICERFKRYSVIISDKNAALIADLVGNNLWTLNHEIEKVVMYANGEPITAAMIENVICPNPSSSIFKLTDFLGERRLKESLRTLEILLNGDNSIMGMFFMLVRHFRLLSQVKNLADRGEKPFVIAKAIKEQLFVVNKIYSQTKYFTMDDLRSIYKELMAIDSGVKTGRIRIGNDDSELIREIEVFISGVCLQK